MTDGGDRIHLYLCRTHWVTDSDHLARCHDLLDDEEKARHARFKFDRDARLFLISHALVRTALSDFAKAPIDPAAWRFEANLYGRPEILGTEGAPKIQFSLSHTHGFAVCAVSATADIGVDAEAESRNLDASALAPRVLSPSEMARFQAASPGVRKKHFLFLWTLKEAFAKARGLGLNLPVEKLSFFVNNNVINFGCPGDVEEKPRDWSFTLMQATSEHCLALAMRGAHGSQPHLTSRWFVPLVGERAGEAPPRMLAGTLTDPASSPC